MTAAYPLVMLAAVVTGTVLARRRQRAIGLSAVQRLAVAVGAFCGAMIGAKLPFALMDIDGLLSGRAWFVAGKTIVLGLVGGYLGVEVAKWAMQIRVKTGDSFAVPAAASIAIGRLACFVGGCCFGAPTAVAWGMDFGDGVQRHPTQLYEFAFHGVAAMTLEWLSRRGHFRGQLIKLYIIAYLVYRFFTEYIRPEPLVAGSWTGYQLACAGLIPLFMLLWFCDARSCASDVRGE